MSTSSSSELLKLLGDDVELRNPALGHTKKPSQVLAGKVVLLYFSASWCGPCQQFSPVLKGLYKKLKAANGPEDFEIVFCSLDRSSAEYEQYTGGMPWYCLPFASPLITKLGTAYANGQLAIPLLVIVDKDGSVILSDAVEKVTEDRNGTNFPWRPPRITDVLPEQFLDRANNLLPIADLDDKYLLLYFSAHWCPPCRRFTPTLSKAYKELKKHRSDFEFLFVSSDRGQESFDEYFAEMTFNAIPYFDRGGKEALSNRFQIRGIPSLVMLGPVVDGDRAVINQNFHAVFDDDGDYLSDFPFHPRRYGDLSTTKENVNTFRCVIVFHELGDDDEQEEIQEYLRMAADQCSDKSVRFFWGNTPKGLTKVVKDILKIKASGENPVMVLLDVPNQSYYISQLTDISTESILGFVSEPGERQSLQT